MSKTGKIVVAVILVAMIVGGICIIKTNVGNRQLFDIHNDFKYAILTRHDGEQIIPIKSWRDFPDGDQIQFTSMDGITYLVHSSDVFLLTDMEN